MVCGTVHLASFVFFSDLWSSSSTVCFFLYPFSFIYFSKRACRHVRSGCEPRTTACPLCLLRLPHLRILPQLLQLTPQLHRQVNLFPCRTPAPAPSVAIFPSRFKWWEIKHGRDACSSLPGFDFYAVSGILQLRCPRFYFPVFRYACCALIYFNVQFIWRSFRLSLLFPPRPLPTCL